MNTSNTNFDRLMDLLVITVIKKRFLRSNKTYTTYVLYTPYKKRIYKINTDYDKFPYKLGDSIDSVEEWCDSNNYDYRKRKGKSNIWRSQTN